MESSMEIWLSTLSAEQVSMVVVLPPPLPTMLQLCRVWLTEHGMEPTHGLSRQLLENHLIPMEIKLTASTNAISNLFYGHVGRFRESPTIDEVKEEERWIRTYGQDLDTNTTYFCSIDDLIFRWKALRRVARRFYKSGIKPINRPLQDGTFTPCFGLAMPRKLVAEMLLDPHSDAHITDSQFLAYISSWDKSTLRVHRILINSFVPDWSEDISHRWQSFSVSDLLKDHDVISHRFYLLDHSHFVDLGEERIGEENFPENLGEELDLATSGLDGQEKKRRASRKFREKYYKNGVGYVCEECGKSFQTNRSYGRHLRTHEENTAFPCPFCPKKYNRKDTRIRHMVQKHADAEEFSCPDCGLIIRTFVQHSCIR